MPKLSAHRLRELLSYDPLTGIFRWKIARSNRIAVGQQAGSKLKERPTIRIDGRHYRASRLAFLIMTGKWPKKFVDHKNLITYDNRWSNLREATHSQNAANSKTRNKKLALKGVRQTGKKSFHARITVNNRTIGLGKFSTMFTAHAAYIEAAKKHFGEFARR
jgi:HNH endonuclease